VRLLARVHPGSHRTVVEGGLGEDRHFQVDIRVTAPAVGGRANRAAGDALARAFGVRRSAVTLVSGAAGRTKLFEIDGIDPGDFPLRLKMAGAPGKDLTERPSDGRIQ